MKLKLQTVALTLALIFSAGLFIGHAFTATPGRIAKFDGGGNPTDSNLAESGNDITHTATSGESNFNIVNTDADEYGQLNLTNDVGNKFQLWMPGSNNFFHGGQALMYTNELHVFTDGNISGGDGSINFYTEPAGLWVNSPRFKFTAGGKLQLLDVNYAAIEINGNQVVGPRRTGWGTMTGTATRTAFDTSTVTLEQLAQRVKALIDDSRAHGLIGN